MKSFLIIFKREFRLLFYNKSMFTFAVVLPFVSMVFFHSLFIQGVARDLPIAVVDLDNSSISRNIISQLDATPEVKVSFKPASQLEGETLIKELKVYGLVSIPKNLGKDLKQGKQVTIVNQYNGNLLLPGGLENKAFRRAIGTVSAGINIQKQLKKGIYIKQAKANYQPITSDNHTLSNPYTNYSYYLNSGFLTFFFQIFVILTTIYCFGTDLKYNRGEKLYNIGNGNLISIILGKVTPYTLWFYLVGLILYFTMYVFGDNPLNGSKPTLLLALFLLITSSQAFGILFIALSRSFREALTFGSGFAAVSLSFSGITFPVFGMPTVLQYVSQIFPYTHFLQLFLDQTQRGIPVYYSLNSIIILVILTIFPILLASLKLKKLLIKGSFLQRI